MQLCHKRPAVSVSFDDPNLVASAGLVPVLELARRCGLHEVVGQRVSVGANASLKVAALVAGMVAGADSIADMDVLRHGGMAQLFEGVRAPSTLGTFLRSFTFGHVRQLDSVAAELLARLAASTPLLPAAGTLAFVDLDDTVRQTYGHAQQGAGYGYSKVKGLNALLATVATPAAAPVIAAARLRRGSTNSTRGAGSLLTAALKVAARAGADPGAGSLVIVRGDSAFYNAAVVRAAQRAGARFSITARLDAAVRAAVAGIDDTAWTAIRYRDAVWDDDEQRWVSEAEVAAVPFTAFGSKNRRGQGVAATLIVRRVRRLNPAGISDGQTTLFAAYRHHAVFTDNPMPMLEAETCHRGHAIIEQVHADLKNSALAHLPSGRFAANSAWLVLATIAFNLTRAAGCLASTFHARATTATLRRQLINIPARIARSARRITVHLPQNWPWARQWTDLFAATGPPHTTT
jgi:Transposase DDE domain group 1